MLPSGLSMLWETVEPDRALRERFGFDGFAAVAAWVSVVLDEAWGVEARGCDRMVISGRNALVWVDTTRGALVLKWSADERRFATLTASTRVLGVLARRGLPVAAPARTRTGEDRVVVGGPAGTLSLSLQSELVGDWLDVTDAAAVRAAGAVLAQLHVALRDQADERLPTVSRVEASTTAVRRWADVHDRGSAPAGSARLRELLVDLPALDGPPQLVHQDYRAANLLTRRSAVVGVLDFDELAVGRPVGDLAYASVYLRTRFTDWRPTPLAARQQLRAGYESVRALTRAESLWYDALVLWLGIQAIPVGPDPSGWAAAL